MKHPLSIGFLLFPRLTQLDLTGPYEVFSRIPHVKIHLIWKHQQLVVSDKGMSILATMDFDHCPKLDVICIPGGPGQLDLMQDHETLAFIAKQAATADYVTSVCTGSLLLAAAGLLTGFEATCHWNSIDQLRLFDAVPRAERVVIDRNRITGAGVTSGIDFALVVVAKLYGEELAQQIQLQMEYDPAPPFEAGSLVKTSAQIVNRVQQQIAVLIQKRRVASEVAARYLKDRR